MNRRRRHRRCTDQLLENLSADQLIRLGGPLCDVVAGDDHLVGAELRRTHVRRQLLADLGDLGLVDHVGRQNLRRRVGRLGLCELSLGAGLGGFGGGLIAEGFFLGDLGLPQLLPEFVQLLGLGRASVANVGEGLLDVHLVGAGVVDDVVVTVDQRRDQLHRAVQILLGRSRLARVVAAVRTSGGEGDGSWRCGRGSGDIEGGQGAVAGAAAGIVRERGHVREEHDLLAVGELSPGDTVLDEIVDGGEQLSTELIDLLFLLLVEVGDGGIEIDLHGVSLR